MLGKNIKKHAQLTALVRKHGHVIGNHGMNHLNGWTTATKTYVADCYEGKRLTKSHLFRPAYGRLTPQQYNLINKDNTIVFWDVISGDFDPSIDGDTVKKNVVKNARNGSIIVMHDSEKAMKNLKESLNEIIQELKRKGFGFGVLNSA